MEHAMDEENKGLNNQSLDFENFYTPDPPVVNSPMLEDQLLTTPSSRVGGSGASSRRRRVHLKTTLLYYDRGFSSLHNLFKGLDNGLS